MLQTAASGTLREGLLRKGNRQLISMFLDISSTDSCFLKAQVAGIGIGTQAFYSS
ncbi:rCG62440, isoform CRA_c [Rattus norvegicus]|uniref:RCG62440, isoform CRA_c n=1 Tax=Rattus norvegicus TaxID=10116 RepID=A6J689_RAT|nr:rCG62440, isoform CRA_c [Rattus norvegicus]